MCFLHKVLINQTVVNNDNLMEIFSWTFSFHTIGYFFSLLSAIILAVAYFVTKKLNNRKTHFSLINLFTAFFGLPISICFAVLSNQAGYDIKDYSQIYEASFVWDVIYVLISATTSKFKYAIKMFSK